MPQAAAINSFRYANIGATVLAYRNRFTFGVKNAGHAARPKQFTIKVIVYKVMNFAEFLQTTFRAVMHTGNKLQLCFAEIGGNRAMGQS